MSPSVKKWFRPAVRRRKAYTLASYPKLIKLNQNELAYDLPPAVKKKLLARLKKLALNRYPTVQPERLQKKLAKVLGVKPEQLLFTNGSNVLIQVLIQSMTIKGKVMSVEPGFSLFESISGFFENRYVFVRLEAPDFRLPLKKFLATMKRERPKIIFIANPNAPTANLFPEEDLLAILREAKCPVVIDEAYFQFCGATMLPYLKRFSHLIILRTFSKGYGLGGARVGYMVARKELVDELRKALLPYCVPVLSEEAALVALEHRGYFDKVIREVLSERERVFAAMKEIPKLKFYPSQTNFILFRVKNPASCLKHLMKKGVLIRDMSGKHGLAGCLRVTIGAPKENSAFLKAIKSCRL